MTLEEFILLSSFCYQLPPYPQEMINKIWQKIPARTYAAGDNIFEIMGLPIEIQTLLKTLYSTLCNRQNLYSNKEKPYIFNPQEILDFLKNNSGITDLGIEDLVFEGYHEGSAGPGVVLFSLGKEKREKKDKEKTNKIYKINKTLQPSLLESYFHGFWRSYPRRTGKGHAFKIFCTVLDSPAAHAHPNGPSGFFNEIFTALKNQIQEKELATQWECFCPAWPHPSNWLRQQRWTDDVNLNMEFWHEECKRNHKQSDYLRIRDRILAESVNYTGGDDFDSV